MGSCPATFPRRHHRRVSNLVCAQPAARLAAICPRLGNRGDATRTSLAGSPRRRRAPFTLGFLLPAEVPGGGVLGRRHPFISLRSELPGDPAQDFTKRHPRLGFDWLRHGHNHEGSHAREVVKACQGFGNVCRA